MGKPNFFEAGSPFLSHPLLTPERTRGEIDFILAQAPLPPGGRILDIGCGPGRHSLELACRGYEVLGIDPSDAMVQAARRRSAAAQVTLEQSWRLPVFLQARAETFETDQPFDAAICLFTSLGQMDGHGDNRGLVERAFAALLPGGHLTVEVPQRSWVAAHLKPADRFEESDRITEVSRRFDPVQNTVTEVFTVKTADQHAQYLLQYHVFDRQGLRSLLEQVGFVITAEFGGYQASPIDPESPVMVVFAQRPALGSSGRL